MKAVDTNVLARLLIDDPEDPEAVKQQQVALRVLSEPVFVPLTVVLEFAWLVQGFYKFPPATGVEILKTLLGIEHLSIEHRSDVAEALDLHERSGLDFADALHLARSSHMQALLTFDKQFARRAKGVKSSKGHASAVKVELLTQA